MKQLIGPSPLVEREDMGPRAMASSPEPHGSTGSEADGEVEGKNWLFSLAKTDAKQQLVSLAGCPTYLCDSTVARPTPVIPAPILGVCGTGVGSYRRISTMGIARDSVLYL